MNKKAVVLVSGGIDSTVLLHKVIKHYGYEEVSPLFFQYGQNHLLRERDMMIAQIRKLHIEYGVAKVKLPRILNIPVIEIGREETNCFFC
jgi:7-cyano-7-deazaguanine synthase in queuosine biosynthesis